MNNLKTRVRESGLYARFYRRYNLRRDRLIRKYLRYLKSQTKGPMTMENKDRILKYRAKYERLATAYWQTRLNNRPFIIPDEKYVKRETRESRLRWLNYYHRLEMKTGKFGPLSK